MLNLLLSLASVAFATEAKFVKVVTYQVPEKSLQSFLAKAQEDAEGSRRESGVFNFQVLKPEGQPNTVVLLEEYKDLAASELHQKTPHFAKFMQAVKTFDAHRTAFTATPY